MTDGRVRGPHRRALYVIAVAVLIVLLLLLALSRDGFPKGLSRLALRLPPNALELDRWLEVGQLTTTALVGTLRTVRAGVSHSEWMPWFQQNLAGSPALELPAEEEEEEEEEQKVDTTLALVAKLTASATEQLAQWSDWLRGEESRRRLQTRRHSKAVERAARQQLRLDPSITHDDDDDNDADTTQADPAAQGSYTLLPSAMVPLPVREAAHSVANSFVSVRAGVSGWTAQLSESHPLVCVLCVEFRAQKQRREGIDGAEVTRD
jgi:hypothetical protein